MKREQKFNPKSKFSTVELGRMLKAYAPFAKKTPKGEGLGIIDTGYELVNERQVRTDRSITATAAGFPSYRATDSYPVLVDMGRTYLNPSGSAWTVGEGGEFVPNAPAAQVELACVNIIPYIIDKMYTDLDIININPITANIDRFPTTIWPRYFEALAFNSKVIIMTYMKYVRIMSYVKWLASVSSEFLPRVNFIIKETQRSRFIAAMEQLNIALKQFPIHKDIVSKYTPMFNIELDNEEYSGCPTFITPHLLPHHQITMEQFRQFCTVSGTNNDLLLNDERINTAEATHDLGEFCHNFFTLPMEDVRDEDDNVTQEGFQTYATNLINTYRQAFIDLAYAIGAIAVAYRPLTTALMKIGSEFFGNMLYSNFSLETMGGSAITLNTSYYVYGFLNGAHFHYNDQGALNRTVTATIPLFNSFSPIDLFSKNGILAAVRIDNQDENSAYTPLLDVTEVTFRRAYFFNSNNVIGDGSDSVTYTFREEGIIPGTFLSYVDSNTPLGAPTFNLPERTDDAPTDPIRRRDLGFLQFLKAHFVQYNIGTEAFVHEHLSGFRDVNYSPVTEYVINLAPIRFGVSTNVTKNITG